MTIEVKSQQEASKPAEPVITYTTDTTPDAIALAERGWYVFPIPPNTKAAWEGWPDASSSDPDYIRECWPDADANIAVHCGPSGLLVVDIDEPFKTYDDLLDGIPWPPGQPSDTFTVRTASGKWHLYYSVPGDNGFTNRTNVNGLLIDVRVNNGYVLGPGSMIDGRKYEVAYDDPVIPLPAKLAQWIKPPEWKHYESRPSIWGRYNPHAVRQRKLGLIQKVVDANEGNRNPMLHWVACRAGEMIAAGEWEQCEAEAQLAMAAEQAGLGSREIDTTIRSGIQMGIREYQEGTH